MNKNIVCGAFIYLIFMEACGAQSPDGFIEKKFSSAPSYKRAPQTGAVSPIKATTKVHEPVPINCDYRISAETKIDKALIVSWAEYAVLHSFNFESSSFENQLKNLRTCFTANGWMGFTNALKESGNMNFIKNQNLQVSSILDGEVQLIETQKNQWKITVPIKVFYKNDKEVITHFLNVYTMISWRNAFKLGIVQMVTTPRAASISLNEALRREALNNILMGIIYQMNTAVSMNRAATSFLTSLFSTQKNFLLRRIEISAFNSYVTN